MPPDGGVQLSEAEWAILDLATEDAFALWELASEVGGDLMVAQEAVRRLLHLGLIELGVEDWSITPHPFVADGQYVSVPFTGDAEVALADPEEWGTGKLRRLVVWATPAGDAFKGDRG